MYGTSTFRTSHGTGGHVGFSSGGTWLIMNGTITYGSPWFCAYYEGAESSQRGRHRTMANHAHLVQVRVDLEQRCVVEHPHVCRPDVHNFLVQVCELREK
jgi:hypothetical protein